LHRPTQFPFNHPSVFAFEHLIDVACLSGIDLSSGLQSADREYSKRFERTEPLITPSILSSVSHLPAQLFLDSLIHWAMMMLRACCIDYIFFTLQPVSYHLIFANMNVRSQHRHGPLVMSPNSDNAMARFLFAILKQKNLKDVGLQRDSSKLPRSSTSRLTGTKLLRILCSCSPFRMATQPGCATPASEPLSPTQMDDQLRHPPLQKAKARTRIEYQRRR
jgi:hypothetical protein